jgi:hypothetical protein
MRCLKALAVVMAVVGCAGTAFAGSCPESCLDAGCSTAAARESTVVFTCEPYASSQGRMSYDLVAGHLLAEARGCTGWYGAGGGGVSATARDRYLLVGPPGGGPVAFEARLRLRGGVGGEGTCGGSIAEPGGAWASADDGGTYVLAATLSLPLVHAAGEEFQVECYAYGSAGGAGSIGFAEGWLTFANLPAGYGIVSCQGFAGEGAVPARGGTWGSVKALYR